MDLRPLRSQPITARSLQLYKVAYNLRTADDRSASATRRGWARRWLASVPQESQAEARALFLVEA